MAKVCFYIMTGDHGFAPNPFHGWCTLAACTPNHRNADFGKGDYIAGVFRSGAPPRLVYVMEVAMSLDFDSYYRDRCFDKKKPRKEGSWQERAGDNIYFINAAGEYVQDKNACFHTSFKKIMQDLKHPTAFLGRRFAYFGEKAETVKALLLPKRFHWCLPTNQGTKDLIEQSPDFDPFVTWAFSHGSGLVGLPRDRDIGGEAKKRAKCRPDVWDDQTDGKVRDNGGS